MKRLIWIALTGAAFSCLTIAAGQSVTFSGDFYSDPLRAGVAPSAGGGAGP